MTGVVDLGRADRASAGGKAGALGALLRAGVDVPPGFVLPQESYRDLCPASGPGQPAPDEAATTRARILGTRIPPPLRREIAAALARLTDGASTDHVAVRSSANTEDRMAVSAAGQHDTVLAVRGLDAVCRAVVQCWASLWTDRAVAYRARTGGPAPEMAVLVQRFIDAEVSGVMFTGRSSTVEATWGLGDPLVRGHITPDRWQTDGTSVLGRHVGAKQLRADRQDQQIVTTPVPGPEQEVPCLDDRQILDLHWLGRRLTAATGDADVEWAMARGRTWVLQARPVTAALPALATSPIVGDPTRQQRGTALIGEAASSGVATGTVRVVRGPADFSAVKLGDVLVCRVTDPAWTPLFTIASAVVTETGGVLSHAAIVAREIGIPAVLSVSRATHLLADSPTVTVDGDAGSVSRHDAD